VAIGERICERDGVGTQLTCAGCGAPICPRCLVRTPVGLKCPDCTGAASPRARTRVPVAAVAAVVLVPLLAWLAFGAFRSDSKSGKSVTADATGTDVNSTAGEGRPGQEMRSGPFGFTVTQVECVGQQVGTPPSTRVAQGRFCLLYLTLRNTGDRPELFSGTSQFVVDSSAKRYNPGVMESGPLPPPLVLGAGVREITSVRVNPGGEVRGVLIFDMPSTAKPAEFEFHSAPRTIGVQVRLDTFAS